MIQLTDAIVAAILADTVVSTVGSGSSTTVVQLGAGDAADLPPAAMVSFTGSGATAANDKQVRTVRARDLALDTITVAALPVAPAAGNLVKAGCREWLVSSLVGGAGVYEWGMNPSPVEALASNKGEKRPVLMYGAPTSRPGRFELVRDLVELDLYGHDTEWLAGLVSALRRLLHARPDALTIAGHKAHELLIDSIPLPIRRDPLKGAAIMIQASVAAVVG